ncbi:unnamed protein product [Effrenium voratum]|nr:unnamed protein product [Effrenium voratum]
MSDESWTHKVQDTVSHSLAAVQETTQKGYEATKHLLLGDEKEAGPKDAKESQESQVQKLENLQENLQEGLNRTEETEPQEEVPSLLERMKHGLCTMQEKAAQGYERLVGKEAQESPSPEHHTFTEQVKESFVHLEEKVIDSFEHLEEKVIDSYEATKAYIKGETKEDTKEDTKPTSGKVLLLDDASRLEPEKFSQRQWQRLQGELEAHLQELPKVALVRLKARRGLMKARMEGIWRARGEIIVCLDSHVEATPGWLEPLLWRVAEDRTRLVVPSIDGIDTEDFSYAVFGLGLVSFNWLLNQKPRERPEGEDSMAPSSVMCGGLFAADRSWFLHLGGYDPELQIYGGEEMEIGFSAWQCGGSVMHEPRATPGGVWYPYGAHPSCLPRRLPR